MTVRLACSLASAPLDQLRETLAELDNAGINSIHFDLEDGSFVPLMTLGTKLIPDLRPQIKIPFDVHLMMVNPEWLLGDLARWGVNRISIHYEACPYPRRILRQIASLGLQAGLAFNPATSLPNLAYLSPYLSFILILSTEPEISDCPFLPEVLHKVREGKRDKTLVGVEWVVDGGVNAKNLAEVVAAGADEVVVGRAVFENHNITENIRTLRAAIM
jgi:ribulose-phosphate 3-epimerase